jgi:hypothetical protein
MAIASSKCNEQCNCESSVSIVIALFKCCENIRELMLLNKIECWLDAIVVKMQ